MKQTKRIQMLTKLYRTYLGQAKLAYEAHDAETEEFILKNFIDPVSEMLSVEIKLLTSAFHD
jgi:hypothetical protein